jgi:DNA-binding NtrC family response regulator
MRETLDCGVLMVPAHAGWMDAWMDRHAENMARVRLHAVALDDDGALLVAANGVATAYAGAPAAAQSLARLALSLRRFDACLLPVAPDTLGWTRTALSCARDALRTPLIGLARGLKAAAVVDLLALGMSDFVRDPLCPEELRVRVDRVAGGRRTAGGDPPGAVGAGADPISGNGRLYADMEDKRLFRPRGDTSPSAAVSGVLQEPTVCYAGHDTGRGAAAIASAAAAARMALLHGDARPRLSREAIGSSLLAIQAAPRVHPDEPFRIAKSRVVDSFESDYVRTALSRHAGNVARAARASAKHRRAFWALMRKHRIDAAPYRPRLERKDVLD